MQNNNVMGLFAEPVARYKIWAEPWQAQLLAWQLERRVNHSYSLDDHVLDHIPQLRDLIESQIQAFARTVMAFEDQPEITQSWINRYDQGDSIHQHNHPNSQLSATWYWQLPQESQILFHKQGLNSSTTWTQKFDRDPHNSTMFSTTVVRIPVSQGDLLVWPSYLIHSTPEHELAEPRYSLSLNAQPRTWGSDLYRSR